VVTMLRPMLASVMRALSILSARSGGLRQRERSPLRPTQRNSLSLGRRAEEASVSRTTKLQGIQFDRRTVVQPPSRNPAVSAWTHRLAGEASSPDPEQGNTQRVHLSPHGRGGAARM
jgi:hypothetical protein